MFKLLLIILLFCKIFYVHAQEKTKIDNLVKIIQTNKIDTIKINAINELSWEYRKIDFKKAKNYALKAYTLSSNINYSNGKLTSLNRLGTAYIYNKQFNQAEKTYLHILDLELKQNNKYGIGRAKNQLSEIYRNKKDLKKALEYSLSALKIFENLNNQSIVALISNNIGLIYQNMGSYKLSMSYLLKSIKIREQLGEELNTAYSYMNLGVLLLSMKSYENSKRYLLMSETIFLKYNDNYELSKIYNNLGIIYFETGKNDLAKTYYDKSSHLKKILGIINNDPDIYNNLGVYYYNQGNNKNALFNYQKSILIQNNSVNNYKARDATLNIAHLYYLNQEYDKAIKYYKIILNNVENSQQKVLFLNALNGLYLSYYSKSQYDSAIFYGKKYTELRDSMEIDFKKAIDLKQKYEQKKKEIELLIKDKKIAKINIEKKNILIYTLSLILILCILLFFAFLRWKNIKQKILIAEKDKKLKQQKIKDLLKNQELKSINDMIKVQEDERKRISQDLHDRLGSILSVAKVYYKSIEDQINNKQDLDIFQYQKGNKLLDEACKEVRKISYEMSSGVLTKFGLIAAIEDLKVLIEQSKQINIEFITFEVDNRLENKTEIGIYRIIQELLSNILKHSQAKNVSIQILKHTKGLNILVEDDGIGFNPKILYQGMGLKNIHSRVFSLGGKITIDSITNRGTSVSIEIPINTIK